MNVTVYLKGRYGPGNADWHSGTLVRQSQSGITIRSHGEDTFYPWTNVESVKQ